MKSLAATTIAGCFALSAFAVAVVAGFVGGNPTEAVLVRALVAMVVCYPVGLAVGLVAQRIIQEHIDAHRAANPAHEVSEDAPAPMVTQNVDEYGRPTDEEVIVV